MASHLFTLAAAGALLALAEAAPAGGGAIVEIEKVGPRHFRLEALMKPKASSQTVWGILTDYERIPEFSRAVRKSRVLNRENGTLLVEQETKVGLLIFSRSLNVVWDIEEIPYSEIRFQDISGEDFEVNEGAWRLKPAGDKVELTYAIDVRPKFSVPSWVAMPMMKKSVRRYLEDVEAEILRREGENP